MSKKLFWLSWYELENDYRPITYPPNADVLGWWCTGYRGHDDAATIVALVVADDEDSACEVIQKDWPQADEWRFCDEVKDTNLGSRFCIEDWMQERITKYNNK